MQINDRQNLHLKSQGKAVTAVQEQLHRLGFGSGMETDSFFGPDTEEVVRKFQQKLGLEPDGIVGPKTQEQLEQMTRAEPIEPKDKVLPEVLQLAGYNADDLNRADRLDITPEVEALCSVIAARDVSPPLSVGLFGDSGVGKSFFMKKNEPYSGFEQGPIRPPSESGSLLIRVTRNCPWNRCTFCSLYKDTTFSLRPVNHVLKDIDLIRSSVERIKNGETMCPQTSQGEAMAFHAGLTWIRNGMKSVFLQDSNSLIMKPDDLITILHYLTDAFPEVERITSYARSHTIARISDQNLDRMGAAGLNRIHVGMESASDKVLSLIQKGTDKAMQIRAGHKVKQAGMQLSEYFIPGLGGKVLSKEHALETADALNQINPDFIRLRTLAVPSDVELFKDLSAGTFEPMGDTMVAEEILLFIESLQGITSTVKSDHILNLFQEVEGTLPAAKEQMTNVIRRFLAMGIEEQMLYQIGRRSGIFSKLGDLRDSELRKYAEGTCSDLKVTAMNIDRIVAEIMKRFI